MKNKNTRLEKAMLWYKIDGPSLEYVNDNLSTWVSTYRNMKTSGARIDAWIGRWDSEGYRLYYLIEANNDEPIEQALETLFNEQGLPDAAMKPGGIDSSTRRGIKIADKVLRRYGARLRTPFYGALFKKNVVRD